jgi:hypothetical protein
MAVVGSRLLSIVAEAIVLAIAIGLHLAEADRSTDAKS